MARIGQYQIGDLLGEGGIGRVHAAYDVTLGREVAVKSLRPEFLRDAGFVERFRTEASNLAKLSHPNITTVYSLIEQGRSLFMVMERVHGQTLEELLRQRRGGLGVAESLAFIVQAANGLAYAHSMGLIHRDIKPANIMIIPSSGQVKIMDFGIARMRGSQRQTRDGSIIGTLAYMAPEQLRDESTDERSDLYSLGIVLYEMLTGVPPFVADTEYGLMQAQINAKPQCLRNLIPHADARLEAVLNRALAKRPAQRFASMSEFRDAISDCGADAHVAMGFPGGDPSNPATKVRGAILDRLSLSTAASFPMLAAAALVVVGLVIWGILAFNKEGSVSVQSTSTHDSMPTLQSSKNANVEIRNDAQKHRTEIERHESAAAMPSDGSSLIYRQPQFYPGLSK